MMLGVNTLQSAGRKDLKSSWKDSFGIAPSPRLSSQMMRRILICEAQWQATNRSRSLFRQSLQQMLDSKEKSKPIAKEGARLVREWNGEEHVVDVVEAGYLWRDKTWTSLSAIAREITGTRWSGPRFFGVSA
ncbi:MAG: DUF2924 domain-containing protein [Pseudomonadota bacterium]